MKIYTKTGDEGTTALYGGERVAKDALRVQAYGSVDEANAAIGMVRSHLDNLELDEALEKIQNTLFDVGADLATPNDSKYQHNITAIDELDAQQLEKLIDKYEEALQPLKNFILPGGHPAAAALHLARTVTRRAERDITTLAAKEGVNPKVSVYLNRLSDLLFVFARVVNMNNGVSEVRWHVKRRERGIK
jgi:cob(I)alamin adenosyltransferase